MVTIVYIFVCGHYLFREADIFPRAFPSSLFCNVRSFEDKGIFRDIPQYFGIFGLVACLDQSRASENI